MEMEKNEKIDFNKPTKYTDEEMQAFKRLGIEPVDFNKYFRNIVKPQPDPNRQGFHGIFKLMRRDRT